MKIKEINELLGTNYTNKKAFIARANWFAISINHELTEEFIREFKDHVVWKCICYKQKLSDDFIREFKEYIGTNWVYIFLFQKLSEEFIAEFRQNICQEEIDNVIKLLETYKNKQ